MIWFFWASLVILSAGAAWLAFRYGSANASSALALVSAWGSILAVGAWLFLPWLTIGGPGTFEKNARVLTFEAGPGQDLRTLPVLQDIFARLGLESVDAIRAQFQKPQDLTLIVASEQSSFINGWMLASLVKERSLTLWVSAWVAVICAVLGLGLSFMRLFIGWDWGRWGGRIISVLALVSLLFLLFQLPGLEHLGGETNLSARMLTALLEVHLGPGGGWALLGTTLAGLAFACDWTPLLEQRNSPSSSTYSQEYPLL